MSAKVLQYLVGSIEILLGDMFSDFFLRTSQQSTAILANQFLKALKVRGGARGKSKAGKLL